MRERKPTADDSTYVDRKLGVLRDQIDKVDRYLSEKPWDKIEDDDRREREFKFQKSLSDSLMQWTESYIKMCGIMEVYNQLEAAKGRSALRANQSISGIQMYVKKEADSKLKEKKK